MSNVSPITSEAAAGSKSSSVVASAFALILGAFLIIGAGFAHSDVLHNAAHDARHTNAFPCH